MIFFAATGWLWAVAAAGAIGGWALWRGQRRQRTVPSVKLWGGLAATAGQQRRRVVDPLWALVWLAAILGAVALAGPHWRRGAASPAPIDVVWNVRSPRPAGQAEAWIQVGAGAGQVDTLRINGRPQPVTAAELRQGITSEIPGTRAELSLEHGGQPLASAAFDMPPDSRVFSLLRLSETGRFDPDIDRFFLVQGGARIDDPSIQPAVALLVDSEWTANELAGAAWVLAQPDAHLPGIKSADRIVAEAGKSWTPEVVTGGDFAWPQFVSLKDVHVRSYRPATVSADWQILARVNGDPWIAVRRDHGFWLWLASLPATETDWARAGAGFVAFLAEMQARALGKAGEQPFVEWTIHPAPPPLAAASLDLQPFLGIAAIALLIAASLWLILRQGWKNVARPD